MKHLDKTETIKRENLAEWFIKALEKQGITNVEKIEIRYYSEQINQNTTRYSQELIAYSCPTQVSLFSQKTNNKRGEKT